jgi:SOS response associated peptidase (SRAP)
MPGLRRGTGRIAHPRPHPVHRGETAIASYAVVTTRANALLAGIHDRMGVVVRPEDEEVWLSRQITVVEEIEPAMEPVGSDEVVVYPAATAVNDARRDGPVLIRRQEPGQLRLARANYAGHSDEVVVEHSALHDGPAQLGVLTVADRPPDGIADELEFAPGGRVAAEGPPIEGVVNCTHGS